MNKFPNKTPSIGLSVEIQLKNGSVFPAYWDGLQWWMGVNDDPNDVPITNEFVESWTSQE